MLKTQKYLVLGLSKSGNAVARYLLTRGATCFLFEEIKNEKTDSVIRELIELGGVFVTATEVEKILIDVDLVIISPGVPINHNVSVLAKKMGKRIIGELEFGYELFTPPIVAVTGTNGKTTTISIMDHIFNESNVSHKVAGNIGTPLTAIKEETTSNDVILAEVSSFQLESVHFFRPQISCILNLMPDHLERHYTMENYVFLKKRIFKNQTSSDFVILNYDDDRVKTFAQEAKSKIIWVSIKEKISGAYSYQGKLYYNDEYIIDENELAVTGEHNVYNSLFAIAVSKILDVKTENISSALKSFKGVKHRIELVCEKNGVKYYNDSKATNTSSTISAIKSMKNPTVLVLGGSEKGERYDKLFEEIKQGYIKHVVLTGASRINMFESATKLGYYDVTITGEFYNAIKIAKTLADIGDNVLLSPACASFDKFSSFEERGEEFRKIVESFQE